MTTPLSLGDEICEYLQGLGSAISTPLNFNGAGSVNLFSSLMPDLDETGPDICAAVYERPGRPPIMLLTGGPSSSRQLAESKLDRPVIQIRVRSAMSAGYVPGNSLVQSIFSALQGVTEQTLNPGGALFHLIEATGSPAYLGRDNRERHEWSQAFAAIWENDQR